MARTTKAFWTGDKAAITDGKRTVTFDTPADFSAWLEEYPGTDLSQWQWIKP